LIGNGYNGTTGHKPSFALRNAIEPLFNDVADRDFFGRPRDFMFAAGLGARDGRKAWTFDRADDAIRTLRLAREAGGWDLVKLEVLGEAKTLYPDMRETLKATEVLAKEGFLPMVYCVDDPIAAKQLEDAGAVAVMPLGAPIGSGLGIQNRVTIRLIVEGAKVPVLVDAGVGTASDAAVAMELGCDGVLMHTAIAEAKNPIAMATAMKLAVQSGRMAYLSGRMGRRMYADPSSPLAGLI
jgi:thiazole synthase